MKKNNFQIIYPECLSFYEQVKIFSKKTSIIIGPHGSGHFNSLFSKKAKIIEFQRNFTRIALGFYTTAKVLEDPGEFINLRRKTSNRSIKVNIEKLDTLLKLKN